MKRAAALILALVMAAALVPSLVPVSAANELYQTIVTPKFNHIVKVSYDEVRYSLKPNGSNENSCLYCGKDPAKIDTPHLPENTQSAIFWGWITANGSDIESFSYVQEGMYTLSLPKFMVEPEPAVLAAAQGEFTYRFHIIVPVDPAGIRTVQLFANFADGTREEFWRARVYIPPYDESTFVDPLPAEYATGDVNGDGFVNNKDVMALFKHINGDTVYVINDKLDVNGDGAVNNKDIIALFKYINTGELQTAEWREAEMYDPALYNSKTAVQLTAGGYLSQHFHVNSPFKKLSASCPSWSNNVGNIRLTLYRFDNDTAYSMTTSAIATKYYENYQDNAWLDLEFPPQEAGDYVIVFSDPTETVGLWVYPSDVAMSVFTDTGIQMAGEAAMKITVSGYTETLFSRVQEDPSGGLVPDEPDDSPAIKERDAMPDTWVATDGLGRVLPTNADVGDPKQDKYVGLFYWTWHVEHAKTAPPVNVQQICDQYPDAVTNHSHSIWNTIPDYQPCFWNEPVYGYYTTTDKWVLRKHAELLADAGVDVIIFDNTNGTFTWRESYMALLQVFKQAREDGVKTPKISFILPFGDDASAAIQLREIYQTAYKGSGYEELWFYWEGKPLIMSLTTGLDKSKQLDAQILNFFTFRQGVPQYNDTSRTNTTSWGWLARYPQATYTDPSGKKQISVGVAQNWSKSAGLTAMNGSNIFGRTYTSKGYDTRPNAKLYGANFAEQWEYALKQDPDFVFVTGWNEWVAGKHPTWQGVKNAFPDEFNDEYSRDIEPSTGDLKDHYYYQLVSYIRKFKGVRAAPEPSAAKSAIYVSGALSQWDDVGPYYVAYKGNTFGRDSDGYKTTHYTNTTGRNDIIGAKVARDAGNLYFYVECADDITPYTDKAWMRLFIDVGADENSWEGFEYVVNRTSPTSSQATLERSSGGWNFITVGKVSYKVTDNCLVIKIPKTYLGINTDKFTVNFKWNDNMQNDGDIMDFYSNGDTAPGGRFMYSYVVK